eukprot:2312398-Pyramimonas_sp.AAC.1
MRRSCSRSGHTRLQGNVEVVSPLRRCICHPTAHEILSGVQMSLVQQIEQVHSARHSTKFLAAGERQLTCSDLIAYGLRKLRRRT